MIYAIFFIILVLGSFITPRGMAKPYLSLIIFSLFLIMGLRDISVGTDTRSYVQDFLELSNYSVSEIFNILRGDYIYAGEPLYPIFLWLVGQISTSTIFFLLSWAIIPCYALYKTIGGELDSSKDFMIALLCFFCLNLFAFFVAGFRQTMAISLIFFAYPSLKKIDFSFRIKSYLNLDVLKAAIYIFLAYNFHNSALIFLIVLPFLKIKIRWWYLPIIVVVFFVGSFIQIDFLVDFATMFFDDRFESYGTIYSSSQSMTTYIIQFILFLICFFQREKLIEKNKSNIYLFNLVLFGLFFQSFSGLIAEMFRISYFFSIFLIILVPRAMKEYPIKMRIVLYSCFTLALLIYLFLLSGSALPPYSSSIL